MTRRQCVTDEQRGKLWRRLIEVDRRIAEGTIEFDETMDILQHSVIEPRLPSIDIFETYSVALLTSQKISVAQLVKDGLYDEFDRRIPQPGFCREDNFVRRSEVRTATVIRLNLPASKNRVIQSLGRYNLRPLSAREFLCFGKSNPRIMRSAPLSIVAVGGSWRLSHEYPETYLYLEESCNQRTLKLKPEPENGWGTDCMFIGFRKRDEVPTDPPIHTLPA